MTFPELREVRYSIRNLLKAPAFAIMAILTLALGIGASTAVFTVVDSVILKPLSYRDAGQLVIIWEKVQFLATRNEPYTGANPRHENYWKSRATAFSSLCLLSPGTRGVSLGGDHPHLIGSLRAQPNFFNTLEVTPMMGRNFISSDAIAGHDTVAIITYSMWQGLLHGDPDVIGKNIRVADVPHQVIGVLPENFRFPKRNVLNPFPSAQSVATAPPIEMVTPLVIDPNNYGWDGDFGNFLALGRLRPGVSVRQAESQMNIIQRQMVKDVMPAGDNISPDALLAFVQPMQDAMIGNSRKGLWMLMAAVIGLMLIACVNLANTQLGRAVSREREAGVRSALGASKWQLIWSGLAESVVLAIVGGAAGILLAFAALTVFKQYGGIDLPRMSEIQPNYAVLLFATAVVIGSALLFGIVPAVHLVRTDPQKALAQNSARTQGSVRNHRLRLALIGVQVFGCTALLLITGLFAKSLAGLLESDRGFDTSHVVAAEVNLRTKLYDKEEQRLAFHDGVLARLRSLPGVTSAALVSAMPLEGETWIDGIQRPDKPANHTPLANFRWVSSGYLQLLHEKLVAGRFLEERDRAANSVVVSEAAARAAWPNEDPVGRPMKWRDKVFTVVGVVADARTNSLKVPPVSMVYLPYETNPWYSVFFLVRSAQTPEALIPDIRRAIWEQDPEVTIARVKTLDSQVKDSLSSERFETFILIAFGIAALLLAMLGVYGVLSYVVAGRTQEFGLRMALGATRQNIYSVTMTEAAIPVLAGLAAGWAASVLAAKLVQKLLYGVTAVDWLVTTIVVVLFVACAAAAAFLPARRAARIDPMQALRAE